MSDLSETEFKSAVDAVAALMGKVTKVAVDGFTVVLSVRTNSRKGHWNTRCDFDPDTGDVACTGGYRESGVPGAFFREVRSHLRQGR